MKIRWITTIVLIVMFNVAHEVGYGEEEQLCQPTVVVMFGNGVWNSAEDTNESAEFLEDALEIYILEANLNGITIVYDSSHNPSEGTLKDLLETAEQIIESNYSLFWRFLSGLDILPDEIQDEWIEISNRIDADIISANPSIQEHIDTYDEYLREGKQIVLVAHSQGNLYGNVAYLGIDQQYIDGFGIVSVANPDTHVKGGGPYTTIEEDYVILPLQITFPFALPANVDNFFGPVNLNDWSGHKFIDSYMATGHEAETKILDDIVTMIGELRSSDPNTEAIEIVNTYNILSVACGNPGTTWATLSQNVYVTEIHTYHWCDKGLPAGTHALYNIDSGVTYGPFSGTTDFRSWISYPNTYVPAGIYEVIDSKPHTWSHTGNGGFVIIEGIVCY
ncbi:MAG: hypothetical protein MRJ65_17030 [Candidatus Brocadiaceae bacterium]|nr:hypothetical protein [Candidatus Brocadiaceae bacterium]